MCHSCSASAHIQRRAGKFLDAEEMKANACANDINNCVHCAHFMKMNLLERHVVDSRFSLAEFRENGGSAIANPRCELRVFQNFENQAERAMFLLILRLHLDVGRGHAVLPDFVCRKLPSRNLESSKFRPQVLDRTASVHERPEGHVATNTGETVKIGQFHGKTADRWDF